VTFAAWAGRVLSGIIPAMLLSHRQTYSAAERLSDAVVHISGLTVALMAVPVLVTLAILLRGDAPAIVSTTLYGVALVAMLLCSALYNMAGHPEWRAFFRHFDQTAIYMKIAATYTPFILLSGGQGAWLLPGLWGAAFLGSGMRMMAPDRLQLLAVAIALAMGWAGLFAGESLLAALSGPVLVLIVTGGVLYTVGVGFFLWDRLPFHITIWHLFVLAASMVFYAAITVHLVQTA
jgi:hemolysin III